jgi:hypothetical protein
MGDDTRRAEMCAPRYEEKIVEASEMMNIGIWREMMNRRKNKQNKRTARNERQGDRSMEIDPRGLE